MNNILAPKKNDVLGKLILSMTELHEVGKGLKTRRLREVGVKQVKGHN